MKSRTLYFVPGGITPEMTPAKRIIDHDGTFSMISIGAVIARRKIRKKQDGYIWIPNKTNEATV